MAEDILDKLAKAATMIAAAAPEMGT